MYTPVDAAKQLEQPQYSENKKNVQSAELLISCKQNISSI